MNGVSEQEIMRRTGHRCEKSVRKYKRSSEQIEMDVSKILDPPMNEAACDTDPLRKKVKSGSIPCENILQDLTNSNKAVFANCNFNFSMNSNFKKNLHEMGFFSSGFVFDFAKQLH